MRLILTIVILSITSILAAWGQDTNSSSAEETTKVQSVNTQVSSNYYINDRGLAILRKKPIDASALKASKAKADLIKIEKDNNDDADLTITDDSDVQRRVSSGFSLIKEPKAAGETTSNDIEKEEVEDVVVTVNEDVSTEKQKSPFRDRKRQSKYKTLEEAALAVDALMEELKKEERSQIKDGPSMSDRISRGANRSLRQHNSNSISKVSSSNAINKYPAKNDEVKASDNIDDEEFGYLRSYFINGVQVEKTEVDKLRRKDIISKEIRMRNTVTGNPNGEEWYEVK